MQNEDLSENMTFAISVSNFAVWNTRVSISLYDVLLREAEVTVAEPRGHAAANVDAPYERYLGMLQICPFTD